MPDRRRYRSRPHYEAQIWHRRQASNTCDNIFGQFWPSKKEVGNAHTMDATIKFNASCHNDSQYQLCRPLRLSLQCDNQCMRVRSTVRPIRNNLRERKRLIHSRMKRNKAEAKTTKWHGDRLACFLCTGMSVFQ